jgi:hypothetical protein
MHRLTVLAKKQCQRLKTSKQGIACANEIIHLFGWLFWSILAQQKTLLHEETVQLTRCIKKTIYALFHT